MPLQKLEGLKGLKGLYEVDAYERDSFLSTVEDQLKKYRTPGQRRKRAEILYNNMKFKNAFGEDTFNQLQGGEEAYTYRNNLLKEKIVNDEFGKMYSPWNKDRTSRDNKKGLGADWEKYSMMSTDAKLKLLESDYLSPSEFETNWQKQSDALRGIKRDKNGKLQSIDPFRNIGGLTQALGTVESTGEAAKQRSKARNNRILENIYNDDADATASQFGEQVSQAYFNPSIVGSSDEETLSLFKKAITPDRAVGNLGIPEYASHYGVIDGEGISDEMKDFSIDDMRQILAKKAVYDSSMSPEMAMTALNNEAKRYIHDHQGFGKQAAMFAKDVLIASTSYTVDKANGFYNLGLMAADGMSHAGIIDTPTVYIDDQGNVLPLDDKRIVKSQQGKTGYQGEDGKFHTVQARQVDRTTLHNLGKNIGVFGTAGSEDGSILNPQDWTRREQFGVWDKELAKQYENIGSSPYKVAYNPNDDRDLLYESFKMMSFGLADAGAQLIPFGIGAAGKALSTANHVGRVVRGIGAATNTASKFLTAETRFGQIAQGTAGALGIAEAYQRGAFQETLAQNMANLEQAVQDRSQREIYDQYHTDSAYKKQVDAAIQAKAASMKADYMASLGEGGRSQIADEKKLDEMLRARAQDAVLGELVQKRINEHKATNEYGQMQEQAINSAGLAATNTFWPEAIKYGLVNTIGFRKYLYTTPTSVAQKAMNNFKGLREITTGAGRKRLTTDAYKTLTNAEKWKQFGKVAGGQMWGGAWTNGTDDMMTDAAERINEDSYNKYLHSYENGEALADTYSFADGLWSYWKGLQNSLGQETTGEAALVGALGSTISGNLHFTNIASLFTKEGKEAFKNNFQQRYERDENGMLVKGEDGKPIVKEVGWRENWRDRLGFFIQNGVLNEYYGKKQNLRNLQDHADYVNNILDDMDDFKGIESLISSNIGRENALNIGDEKTMRFVQAFNAVHALEQLGRGEKDPSTLSSVVMQHKDMIEKASKLGTEESDMTEEEISNLLGQYYSNNPGLVQTEENNQIALQNIAKNAKKLQEAYQAYNEAEKSIQSLESDKGAPIVPAVRFKMKMSQALDGHWRERLQTMKDEVGDTSSDAPTEGEALIAAVGGKRKADKQLKDFAIQENVLLQGVSAAVSEQQKMLDKYNQAQQALREAEEREDSEAVLQAQKELKEAKDNYDEAIEERIFREDMLANAREKQQRLQDAVDAWEKGTKSKVLSADEIMSLDPVTRAKMMEELEINPLTGERQADPYSAAQRKQIEKLKARLKSQDKTGDPLQKIQDIALLTQRIAQNEDAYHRLSRNPDAAAVQLEKQQKEAAERAVDLINYRNAVTLASYIDQMDHALVGRKGISQKQKEDYVYRTLRNKNTNLLDIIEEDNLLPSYSSQVQKAKEWAHVTSDIDAVLSNMGRDKAQSAAIRQDIDKVIDPSTSKEDIITNLERAIDNSTDAQRQQDYEELLDGLQKLGYQRDTTVIESRKQRKEREEAQRKAEEERKQQLEAAVKEAEARKAAEDAKKKAEEEEKRKGNDDGIAGTQADQEKLLEGKVEVDLGDLGFEDETPVKGAVGTSVEEATAKQQPTEHKDGDVTSEVSEKDGIKKTKFTQYRTTKSGEVKPITGKGGLKIDGSAISEDSLEDAGRFDEIRLSELREADGKMSGTIYAKDSEGTWTQFDVKFDSDPRNSNAGVTSQVKKGETSKPIDVLVGWAEGRISEEDAIKQLDGTEYVKHTKGSPVLGTKDGVHLSNKVEWELGKYIKEKYPFLTYGDASVATGVSTFGGNMNLTVVRDAEGNEYGTPSNFLRSLATNPDGKAAEAVKKGLQSTQQNAESSVNNIVEVHDETLGDVIQGKSPTLEEQVTEAQREGQGEVRDVTGLSNSDKENSRGEEDIETSPTVLSGNAMSEYEPRALEEHRLVHKKGEKEGDSMNQFYEWMENAGIKLQNIIDDELPQILVQNPHTPVKFMRVRPDKNATHDDYMQNHLMLVIDYTGDVDKAHNENNGGVITSDGKKYLIIGTVGYGKAGRNTDKFNLWKMLMDNYASNSHKLKIKAWDWFKQDSHKSERFYVHPDFHTEIVPNSMIPGYLIRQNEADESEQERSISELLNDKDRNPHGYKLDDLGWAIQSMTSFWATNTGGKMIMAPEHTIDNLGRVFVLVPAGNGKLLPAKIEPLHYADGMDENGNIVNPNALNRKSVLWNKIQDLLNQLTSPKYEDRKAAIKQLPMLLYFVPKDKGNKTILIGTDEHDNRITVVNGNQRTTFFLDSNFNREDFFKAVREMNPKINITPSALTNKERLLELEEIGALKTDIAKIGTSGVSYSIYGIDSNGEMIIPEKATSARLEEGSTNSENNIREFRYLYNANYKYNVSTGEVTKDGVPVTGDDMLEYAYKIGTQQVVPTKQEGVWKYYIINTGETPEVVRQNNVGRIEQLSKEEAQKIIDEEVARIDEENRKRALEQALAEQQNVKVQEEEAVIDDADLSFFEEEDAFGADKKAGENQPAAPQVIATPTPSISVEATPVQKGTRTFKQLWRSSDRGRLLDVLRQKGWQDVPMEDMNALKKYLEDKGMHNLDLVGVSEADFDAWLQKLRCLNS